MFQRPVLPVVLLRLAGGTLLGLLFLLGCGTEGPDGVCWMGVDTLFVSGMSIASAQDVAAAFGPFAAYVDTSEAFPEGTTVEYVWARYYWAFEHRRYWLLHTREYDPQYDRWYERETTYVDENGVFVYPLGCM